MNGGMSYVAGGYYGDDLPAEREGCAFQCPAPVGGDHLPECVQEPEPVENDAAWAPGELTEAWGK